MYRQSLSEDAMISDATLRSPEAFAQMAQQFYGRVYFTALGLVSQPDIAEDITQETFLRAWLKRDTVQEAALLLQPWLVRIATNLALQWLRTGQQRSRLLPLIPMEDVTVEPVDDTRPDPRQAAGAAEQRSQVQEAVMALPADLRQVVLLHYAEGLSPSDIARMNGEAPSTVTRRLEKARSQLRQHLESGIATGLAVLKPRHGHTQKVFGVITAAAAIPAATRAQLLQLAADTPPPPMIEAVTSAAHAATMEEAGIMKSIIAKVGAAKLIAGAVAIAAVGGGAYSLSSLSVNSPDANSSLQYQGTITKSAQTRVIPAPARSFAQISQRNGSKSRSKLAAAVSSFDEQRVADSKSDTLKDRIARLQSERITTSPQLVVDDGETSGNIYFNVEIVDVSGYPVAGANVRPTGLRTALDNSNWYGWSPDVDWVTDQTGRVRAYVPQFATEQLETGGITFTTNHPDYAPTMSDMMLDQLTKVVLKQGDTLNIIATDTLTSDPLTGDIEVIFGSHPDLKPEWSKLDNGAVTIRGINEDECKFYLKLTDTSQAVLVSDYQIVRFPRQSEPLYVSMRPTYTVMGRLSDNVRRPVKNGAVAAYVASGPDNQGRYARTEAGISEDGTFILNNLPGGTVRIWGLCDGYSSVQYLENTGRRTPKTFQLTENKQQYILEMEPTATARFRVVDENGNPVSGAVLLASPNVCSEGACGRWLGRRFRVVSDSTGTAVINHPADIIARFNVFGNWELKPYQSPFEPEKKIREIYAALEAGQLLEETLTVYPKGTFNVSADGKTVTRASIATEP